VTVVAVVAGVALGLRAGVATGAIAAFVSNLFLGQGVWTPQQMLGWAACGAVGALLAPALRRRVPLAVVCFVLGLLFSAIMDLWLWYGFFPHTTASLVVVLGRGLWFDLSHAVGNFVLALAIGPELRRMLERYRSRLRTEVVWT
jgi:energy-coupling factor transport system substrate-specific component